MAVVTLTLDQWEKALEMGLNRHHEAIAQGLKDRYRRRFTEEESINIHVLGAAGELAVATLLENPGHQLTINTFKDADIGTEIQVRTRSKAHYELLVREGDKDDEVFILVRPPRGEWTGPTEEPPALEVVGGILGKQAKNPAWRTGHGGRTPAYFVPDEKLIRFAE